MINNTNEKSKSAKDLHAEFLKGSSYNSEDAIFHLENWEEMTESEFLKNFGYMAGVKNEEYERISEVERVLEKHGFYVLYPENSYLIYEA